MTSEKPEKYRIEVPNIIDDLGLDPFERALYVHFKKVCGNDPGGYCNETVRTIHLKLKMSAGQVSQARKSLAERGLIRVEDTRPVVVTIIDIWDLNLTYYQLEREYKPDIDGWTVEQLRLWLSDFHPVKLSSHNDSNLRSSSETKLPEENKVSTDIHHMNEATAQFHPMKLDENMSTQFHTVKQRRVSKSKESNPIKESKELSPKQKLFLTLAELCRINIKASTEKQRGQLGATGKALIDLIADLDLFREKFPKYWKQVDWRGKQGQAPTPPQVQEVYGDYCYWLENGEPIPTQKVSTNGIYSKHNQGQPTGQELKSRETIDYQTGERVLADGTRIPIVNDTS